MSDSLAIDFDAPEDWTVKTIADLDFALSRLADLEREVDENNALEALAVERLRARAEALNAKAQKGIEFFSGHVRAYAEAHKAELIPGKKRSRALLHGVVSWRRSGGGLEVKDRAVLLDWARSQPVELNLVRIKEEPAVDEIKLHFGKTGEIPAGCEVKPEADELSVKAIYGGAKNE